MSDSRERKLDFVLEKIEERRPHVIAVDGPSASGKTTLIEDLSKRIDFSLVNMDDFFLPPELRTEERYKEKGGNIHYERFMEEVIVPIMERRSFSYRRFSCASLTYTEKREVNGDGLIIVEGCYSLHPKFPVYWDLSFLLSVDEDERMRRLYMRSPDKFDDYIKKWIPLEREYFSSFDIEGRASYIL